MKIVLLVEVFVSVYLGINWGSETAGTPGGKVALSAVGILFMWTLFLMVDALIIRLFSRRPTTYRFTPYTPVSEQSREAALAAFKQRTAAKEQAAQRGVTSEAFEAEQYERSREQRQAEDDEFLQRVRKATPLPPTKE